MENQGLMQQDNLSLVLCELRKKELFSLFEEARVLSILEKSVVLRYKRGERLIFDSNRKQRFFFLTQGIVNINVYSCNGEAEGSFFLGKNEFLPFSMILKSTLRNFNLVACTDITIVAITKNDFEKMVHNDIAIENFLDDKKSNIIADFLKCNMINSYAQPQMRVILMLQHMSKKFGMINESFEYVIPRWLTQTKLANLAGTTRETVGKTYRMLRNENLLVGTAGKERLTYSFSRKYKDYL
ncbi:Crp/Fnr family transcriptional regulator [Liquorilactobacillus mali]|uniref:Crp Fnr family transcriptional regulator n=1 Tax=Liquorilactobacillus mali KCTC 3596 = DSM 20444 TaxID=1046596 RepID=J0L0S8_9LACO|nr:Crp/Fnr family transcriptional regulator [Liquorilactobacillus mali]EJF00948.1 Crp/Fnr family transcriptional regulator [Liquorilactobacillus mali KCTC 3596 = DSM 20444]KRN11526.1 Crp Fnr family transcriptional regulator [Liquorilactobacillus mali KCTC 3596 = DSM 20444]QFQ74275.1 Crp/Fnr family transcriptional regulator [Liquorilactobacillus mali]